MDPQVSMSFIPKKSFDPSSSRGKRPGAVGLLVLLSILIFIVSVAAAGGVFLYQGVLKQSITSKSASLALNEKAYDPGVIQELLRMDTRINEAQTLLGAHVAPSAIFAFLSMQTLENVQFTSFTYSQKSNSIINVQLKGLANSFSTIALQSDQFGASKLLRDVVFSGVNVDSATGKVAFDVSAIIVPSLVLYSNALSAGVGAGTGAGAEASSTQQ